VRHSTRMIAYQKDDRPTVAELDDTFSGFVNEAGGEQCVRQFRKHDGIRSAMTKRAQYNTLNARDRFNTTALAESSSSSSTAKEDDDEDETEQSETEDNHDKDERREMKEARRKNKNKKQ
jgi:hypothetical protein